MQRNAIRAILVFAVLLFTLSLHYMIFPMPGWMHHAMHQTDLHRRLCYIPIILGALWFGLRGGLLTAAVISSAVLPLAIRFQGPLSSNGDFVEIVFYFAIGALSGTLVDSKDRERGQKESLERELASAERMAALGRASAGIAHEVRTPLGSIQGATEILAEDYPREHPHRPFFDILAQECKRLGRVVDDFLDLSRPISLERGECDVEAVFEDSLAGVRPFAELGGVRIASSGVRGGERLSLDPHRMRQALVNLLRNAVEASPPRSLVELSFREEPGWAIFEVGDAGRGLAQGDQDRIFEPFFTRRKDGTGLGLPLARQVASAHGGTLTAHSRPEGGALFILRIPLIRAGEVAR
jgi:two-component system, NtrC family, sensor histidine kinase HydH